MSISQEVSSDVTKNAKSKHSVMGFSTFHANDMFYSLNYRTEKDLFTLSIALPHNAKTCVL